MRTLARFAAPLVLAALLCACAAERPIVPTAAAPAPPAAALQPAAPAFTEAAVLAELNALINDTALASPDYDTRLAALAPAAQAQNIPADLRRTLNQVLAFDPPRLRQRWERHQQAQENAAALYAANPPVDTNALQGARIVRRLGPALYLVRLPAGDTAFFSTGRRFKNGARLKGVPAVERQRPKPDRSKGDLVDEMEDQPRTFVEISKQEAKRLESERAPVLATLRGLETEGDALARGVATDLARLDTLTREVNAVIGPRLLPHAQRPVPTAFIRKIKRMSKSYSREQYYRYALPVTGKQQVDAALGNYLEERRAEMQGLLRSTGVGRGRARANVDRIAFTAYTASPTLLSIRFEEFRDTGGAHPNMAYASFVFDMKRQAALGLGEIFSDVPTALAVLSELATRRMELVLDGTMFQEGLAAKAENFDVFVLDDGDMVFTFAPYQVASYAQGTQILRVPLCHPRLLPLLTPSLREALKGNMR